jgi:flagellar hook assembly protein FlgD
VANAGLIHLYRQNDLAAAQDVLAQLQMMAQNGDTMAVEHVNLFSRILQDYQRHRQITSAGLQKQVAVPSQALIPTTTALAQNYPNPFNPETTIRFSLKERQKVRLIIFDITDQRVRTLVDDELSVGEQAISWDGRDQYGKSVASGIYFYELAAGNQVERKKMTLVR